MCHMHLSAFSPKIMIVVLLYVICLCVFGIYVISFLINCQFPERVRGMLETTWHGKETWDWPLLAFKLISGLTASMWGCISLHPPELLRHPWTQLGAGRQVVALRSWCSVVYNASPPRTKSSDTKTAVNIKTGMGFISLSLADDVYFTGL